MKPLFAAFPCLLLTLATTRAESPTPESKALREKASALFQPLSDRMPGAEQDTAEMIAP